MRTTIVLTGTIRFFKMWALSRYEDDPQFKPGNPHSFKLGEITYIAVIRPEDLYGIHPEKVIELWGYQEYASHMDRLKIAEMIRRFDIPYEYSDW